MRKKYKLTGFARLLIFMIIFTPIAYVGASYYQGEDGIAKIKSLFEAQDTRSIEQQIEDKRSEIKNLDQKINLLEQEIKQLEAQK